MNRYLLGTALAVTTIAMIAPASATTRQTAGTAGAAATTDLRDSAASDFNGATEILRGDYPAAERVISEQLRLWPGDTDLLLNLAYVYRHTGRMSEARTLYRDVLTRPDEVLDTQGHGSHWAHTLAQAALVSLDGTQLTAR